MKNIILIGMPGCGKSTVGVVLAKTMAFNFIDTDLIIQAQQSNKLQNLINEQGLDSFLKMENKALRSVNLTENTVISTGGSAVFCDDGMNFLMENGIVIYLNVPINELERRLTNIKTRGIAAKKGEGIADIFSERSPFYKKYAQIEIDCTNKSVEDIVEQIVKKLA